MSACLPRCLLRNVCPARPLLGKPQCVTSGHIVISSNNYRLPAEYFWLDATLPVLTAVHKSTSERFSSSDLAGLKYVDGFGELPGLRGQQGSLRDAPGFELGVGAFAGAGQLGVNAVGGLVRLSLSLHGYGYRCARWPRRSPCPPAPASHRRPVRARGPGSGRRSGRAWRRGADQYPQNLSSAGEAEDGAGPGEGPGTLMQSSRAACSSCPRFGHRTGTTARCAAADQQSQGLGSGTGSRAGAAARQRVRAGRTKRKPSRRLPVEDVCCVAGAGLAWPARAKGDNGFGRAATVLQRVRRSAAPGSRGRCPCGGMAVAPGTAPNLARRGAGLHRAGRRAAACGT